MTLVRIVKDWDLPDLMRQTPGRKGAWGDIQFTLDPVEECDYLVMLNNRMVTDVTGRCPPDNIWMIVQEPYQRGLTDWIVEKHGPYKRVFTHHQPSRAGKYIKSHPALPWHVNKTFDQLASFPIPYKTRDLSWVVSDIALLPGHYARLKFSKFLRKNYLNMDLYGQGIRYIEDKWDGLAPYFFSLAIENNSGPDMWTEKIADCFLSWTIPLYYGCTNLEEYFPEESFIRIDIRNPDEALKKIKKEVNKKNWESKGKAIKEARNRILYHYQLFPFLSKQIHNHQEPKKPKQPFLLPAYRRSLKARFFKVFFKYLRAPPLAG